MEIGQLVRVPVYGGEVVRRVVVQLFDNIVLVSTVQEAEDARRQVIGKSKLGHLSVKSLGANRYSGKFD